MYLAAACLGAPRWDGEDLEKMKAYVDKKNAEPTSNKYCLIAVEGWSWGLYQRNRNLHGCNAHVVYDPHNVGEQVMRSLTPDFNFVRTFGGKNPRVHQ